MLKTPLCDSNTNSDPIHSDTKLLKKYSDTKATSSLIICTINMIKLCIGAGMLTLPWAFRYGTLWPSIIATLFSSVYSLISAIFLVHACEITNIYEYSALLQFIGPVWEICGAISICYVTFSTCLGYMILLPQFIKPALIDIFNMNSFTFDKQLYILIFVIIILYPLSLLKNLNSLKYSSIVGLISVFYCVILLIYQVCKHNKASDPNAEFITNQWDFGIFIAINVCAKAYVCHYSLPPIYESLHNRSIKRMSIVLFLSYIIITIIYLIFAICGYYLFGTDTNSNVLDNFEDRHGASISVARLCMAFSLCGCFPLVFKAGINAIEDKFFNQNRNLIWNFKDKPLLRICIITLIVAILTVLSLFLDDIGPVTSIEGAVTVLFLISVFPILVVWRLGFHADNLNDVTLEFKYMCSSGMDYVDVIDENGNVVINYESIEMDNIGNDSDGLEDNNNENHFKQQETTIIKDVDNLFVGKEEEEMDNMKTVILLKSGNDICKSIVLSFLLFTGVLFGIIGVTMSIAVIGGWYK